MLKRTVLVLALVAMAMPVWAAPVAPTRAYLFDEGAGAVAAPMGAGVNGVVSMGWTGGAFGYDGDNAVDNEVLGAEEWPDWGPWTTNAGTVELSESYTMPGAGTFSMWLQFNPDMVHYNVRANPLQNTLRGNGEVFLSAQAPGAGEQELNLWRANFYGIEANSSGHIRVQGAEDDFTDPSVYGHVNTKDPYTFRDGWGEVVAPEPDEGWASECDGDYDGWHHFAWVYDDSAPGGLRNFLYWNGALMDASSGSPSWAEDFMSGASNVYSGLTLAGGLGMWQSAYGSGAGRWGGGIDEFAFWGSALSASDVEWLANNSLSTLGGGEVIPEPAALGLLGIGLLALRRRRS